MSLKKNEGGIKSGDVVYLQTNKTRKQPNAHLKNENSVISLFVICLTRRRSTLIILLFIKPTARL